MAHKQILDLRNYDVVLSSGINSPHGVSGHLFEAIEYFYYLKFMHGINCGIFIPYKLSNEQFVSALTSKYEFSASEIEAYINNTIVRSANIVLANTMLFVDGQMYEPALFNGIFKTKRNVFLRCNNTQNFDRADAILQDFRLYDDTPNNAVHYVKKLLFCKFKHFKECKTNTALLYATTNCREIYYDEMINIEQKYNFDEYLVLSNKQQKVPSKFTLEIVPAKDLFSRFKTYIYTPLRGTCNMFDCSPRFIAECAYYHKKVIYELNSLYRGLAIRKYDAENQLNSLELTKDDELIKYL